MKDKIQGLIQEVETYIADTADKLDAYKRRFTNKKGMINDLFTEFKTLPKEEKRNVGQILNQLKTKALDRLKEFEKQSKRTQTSANRPHDITLPGDAHQMGARHPLSIIRNKIIEVFERVGFTVEDGPEIEDDWHNFGALNFPPNHPARDMQDTFFIEKDPDVLLRTHTSNTQIRVMETEEPPIRILAPGRVYRNEAISARTHCFFHQMEGLCIDKNVSYAEMRQVLFYFAREMFGDQTEIKLRPSYFPFTEISAEMDVSCQICHSEGCPVCKHSGWVEIMGCGMVDPNVLSNCNIDPFVYTGYAFGMGIERIAQMCYGVPDLRLYSLNDVRFLKQFERMDV